MGDDRETSRAERLAVLESRLNAMEGKVADIDDEVRAVRQLTTTLQSDMIGAEEKIATKADDKENKETHKWMWFFIRTSLLAGASALVIHIVMKLLKVY